MADDLTNRSFMDDIRINTSQEYEVGYWAQKLGVTKEKLLEAVKAVGPMVKDVKGFLRK